MKWPKDRKRAFRLAAKAFGTPYSERTEEQKELTSSGICYTIKGLTGSIKIYFWADSFGNKVGIANDHWWPIRDFNDWTPSCDKERSLFCYLMAALSYKEFEKISG